jgi:hypothetical protein
MKRGGDADDRGPGASGYSPGHEMKERGTVGQSRGGLDRDDRRSMDRDDHRTTGQSRGGRDFDQDRDRGKGASEFSPGDRMHDKRY